MPTEKLSVSWDEISNPKVDDRLKLLNSATAAGARNNVPPEALAAGKSGSLIYNTIFYMSLFGLIGGVLGWGIGASLSLRGDAQQEAREALDARHQIEAVIASGDLTADQGKRALDEMDSENKDNQYYVIARDSTLNAQQKDDKRAVIEASDQWKDFVTNLLFYGISGMTIAIALGIAESAVDRNWRGVVINGSVAAFVGLVGGVVVALFVDRFRNMVVSTIADAQTPLVRQIIANAVQWGTLGLFLGVAPGIVLKSTRKISAGATGGLIGGLIGGSLIDVVNHFINDNAHHDASKLVAISAIGLIAGLGTGLIENAVKTGWLKVTAGLIAGKQFILYRDPTFIGSALSCHIYLFRDPSVGKRHAAVHIVPGGFEIENLPLGGGTLINNELVIGRQRLRNGDRIQIGTTTMLFQEKTKPA